jgi:hypothetical protein
LSLRTGFGLSSGLFASDICCPKNSAEFNLLLMCHLTRVLKHGKMTCS